jgi:hypothetical protein
MIRSDFSPATAACIRPTKKPDVFVTSGFGSQNELAAKRHKRSGSAAVLPASDRFRIAE